MNKNMLDEKRLYCQKILRAMDYLEKIIEFKPNGLDQEVFKQYILLEGAANAVNHFNENGYRITTSSKVGERRYKSQDITEIITDEVILNTMDPLLRNVTVSLQRVNSRYKNWFSRLVDVLDAYAKANGSVTVVNEMCSTSDKSIDRLSTRMLNLSESLKY